MTCPQFAWKADPGRIGLWEVDLIRTKLGEAGGWRGRRPTACPKEVGPKWTRDSSFLVRHLGSCRFYCKQWCGAYLCDHILRYMLNYVLEKVSGSGMIGSKWLKFLVSCPAALQEDRTLHASSFRLAIPFHLPTPPHPILPGQL